MDLLESRIRFDLVNRKTAVLPNMTRKGGFTKAPGLCGRGFVAKGSLYLYWRLVCILLLG